MGFAKYILNNNVSSFKVSNYILGIIRRAKKNIYKNEKQLWNLYSQLPFPILVNFYSLNFFYYYIRKSNFNSK